MKLKLQGKITMIIVILLLILGITTIFLSKYGITEMATYQIQQKLDGDLDLGYELLNEKYHGDWKIVNGKMYKGSTLIGDGTVENGNFELVDEVLDKTDSVATIFMKSNDIELEKKDGYMEAPYVRVSTNVKKEDGNRAVGTKISKKVADIIEGGEDFIGEANVAGILYQTKYRAIKNEAGEILGIWFVGVPKTQIMKKINEMSIRLTVLILIILIIGVLISALFARRISKKIKIILLAIKEVENQNLSIECNIDSQDEIGEIADHLNSAIKSLRHLINGFKTSSKTVAQTSSQLSNITGQTTIAVEEVSRAIEDIASGASDQAKSMEESTIKVSALADEIDLVSGLAKDINNISRETNRASQDGLTIVGKLSDKSESTKQSTDRAMKIVFEVDKISDKIGNITGTISQIAEQTNLLALNAAIEAARVGEEGKGFAVVADEIRKLAESSSKSANEIQNIILGIQKNSKIAVESMDEAKNIVHENNMAVNETREIFNIILKHIKNLSDKINDIEGYSNNMKTSKDEIVALFENLAAVTQETSASTEEISASTEEQLASMEEITASSNGLDDIAKELQGAIDKFKIE